MGGFDFSGPYRRQRLREDGGHRLRHGVLSGHGDGLCSCCDGRHIVYACELAIRTSDLVFVWWPLETDSVHAGTLWEMGFAAAAGVPVVLASPWPLWPGGDYWLAATAADYALGGSSLHDAWDRSVICGPSTVERGSCGGGRREPPPPPSGD